MTQPKLYSLENSVLEFGSPLSLSLYLSVSVCLSVFLSLSPSVSLCLCLPPPSVFLSPLHASPCMCSINRISSSWARDECKKTLCLLHYPRKIKFIHSFIHSLSLSLCLSPALCPPSLLPALSVGHLPLCVCMSVCLCVRVSAVVGIVSARPMKRQRAL